MRHHTHLLALASGLFLVLGAAACGGGDDAVAAGPPDASPTPDAPAGLTGLGELCDGNANPSTCPTEAPICAYTDQPVDGACTLLCGQTPDTGAAGYDGEDPPAGG